jgi:hypothetical protein
MAGRLSWAYLAGALCALNAVVLAGPERATLPVLAGAWALFVAVSGGIGAGAVVRDRRTSRIIAQGAALRALPECIVTPPRPSPYDPQPWAKPQAGDGFEACIDTATLERITTNTLDLADLIDYSVSRETGYRHWPARDDPTGRRRHVRDGRLRA